MPSFKIWKPLFSIRIYKMTFEKEFILTEDELHWSYLNPFPFTPATTIVESKNDKVRSIFDLSIDEYKQLLFRARNVANLLSKNLPVDRVALVTAPAITGAPQIKLIPLHGIDSEWKPVIHEAVEYNEEYQGYCDSKNGPLASDESLNEIQSKIRSNLESTSTSISYEFFGDENDNNLFAKLVRGEIKQWRLMEDKEHVAFLTPFPNTPGFTVIVPRKHLSSDIFSLDDSDFEKIIEVGYKVSKQITQSLKVKSTCMIFEGFEIDYAHIKLIPVNIKNEKDTSKELPVEFHAKYVGYVSSLDGPLFPREEMQRLFNKLKTINK